MILASELAEGCSRKKADLHLQQRRCIYDTRARENAKVSFIPGRGERDTAKREVERDSEEEISREGRESSRVCVYIVLPGGASELFWRSFVV